VARGADGRAPRVANRSACVRASPDLSPH
jgi:hypothetical protein